MTEADSGDASPPNAAPAKKPRKRRPRAKAAPAPSPEIKAPEIKAGEAKPTAPAQPEPLNQLLVEQTSASLAALSANLTEAMTRANQVFSTAFMEQAKEGANWKPDPLGVQVALNEVWAHLARQPETLREAHARLWERYADIWHRHTAYMLTGQLPDDGAGRDKRFKDPEWRSNPAFSMLRESYLATAAFINDLVARAEGVDDATKRKAAFFIKQAVDAASPSNFLMTNPAALRAMLQTKGASLLQGVNNLAEDLQRGHGMLAISQSDTDAFTVGENLATTPGKVVFRNRVLELIQYAPATETVHQLPLLIFPPWINKFYILDLQPKNSMIRWLVGKGYTVFLVSWVNPDEDMASATFEDYMRDGVYAAVAAAKEAAGVDHINAVGYCIGGTLLAATLAHMAETHDDSIASATFFAAQADFKCAGDLLVFTDKDALDYLEEKMDEHGGVLDAQTMADTFNSLRSNDLIWNYVVDNYYMGKHPPPFDLLYWNADQTRMPKALHLFYLREFYRDNALTEDKLTLLGQHLSLDDVKIPIFMQSSQEDHIAPAISVYRSARAFGGPVEYMLAGSGHIAGVINHPDAHKYQHWTNAALPNTLEEWKTAAVEHPGSWWPHWDAWLIQRSGPEVPARTPGEGPLPALCDAPGTYVKVRSGDA